MADHLQTFEYCPQCEEMVEVDPEGEPIDLFCQDADCPYGYQLPQEEKIQELNNLFTDDV